MPPTVHPFRMISVDPITSWPILSPDKNIKKFPILVVMCRQTGFVWHKLLYDWTSKSLTLALLLLQYRFGEIEDIISDRGKNLIPRNINPAIIVDKQEKRLMSLVHTQTPTGGQHENIVESRIKLIKQYCFNIMVKVKGERFKPLTMTQSDFIMATAINEVNNIPLFRHERYVYLTPNMLVNPQFEMSMGQLETNIMSK